MHAPLTIHSISLLLQTWYYGSMKIPSNTPIKVKAWTSSCPGSDHDRRQLVYHDITQLSEGSRACSLSTIHQVNESSVGARLALLFYHSLCVTASLPKCRSQRTALSKSACFLTVCVFWSRSGALAAIFFCFRGEGEGQKIVLQLYSSCNSLQHLTQATCWQGMLMISIITKSNSNTIMGNVWAKSERPQTTEVQCMVKMHAHFSLALDTKWSSDVKAPRLVSDQTAIQPPKMSAVLRHSSQSTRLSTTHSGSSQITMSRKYVKCNFSEPLSWPWTWAPCSWPPPPPIVQHTGQIPLYTFKLQDYMWLNLVTKLGKAWSLHHKLFNQMCAAGGGAINITQVTHCHLLSFLFFPTSLHTTPPVSFSHWC